MRALGPLKLPVLVILPLLCLAPAGAARAQTAAPPTVTKVDEHPRRIFSLTFSPIHLTLPVVELTGEVRVHDKFGVAAVLGAGKVDVEPTFGPKTTASVFEVGAQGRYYVLGDFRHGMQLGAEFIYMHGSATQGGASAVADGFSAGPFAGYKYTADIGFTFDGQLGYQRIGIGGKDNVGSTSSQSENAVLLNLNVGWSF